MKTIETTTNHPKYFLADVPQDLRRRVLDLCFKRLWREGLELLEQHGIPHYTRDDLINFYNWAPTFLPEPAGGTSYTSPQTPEPSHDPNAGRSSAAHPEPVGRDSVEPSDVAPTSTSASSSGVPPQSVTNDEDPSRRPEESDPSASQLHHLRQQLVQLLAARASRSSAANPELVGGDFVEPSNAPSPTAHRSADSLSASSATDNSPPPSNHEPVAMENNLPTIPPLPLGEGRGEGSAPTVQDSASVAQDTHAFIQPSIPSALLTDLRSLITRYVVLPEFAAEALALWVVHTYAFTLREVTTYIAVVSPEKRCGKTTLLELLGLLAHEAVAAANISPSALFRVIEEAQPTLIIDEADTFLQARDEMAGILNAGYRKSNSYVVRVSDGKPRRKVGRGVPPSRSGEPLPALRGGKSELTSGTDGNGSAGTPRPTNPEPSLSGLARYSCWCPKVMAAIGRLPDTLADRCIVITMQRKMPGEKCERMRRLNATEFFTRCTEFVREHSDKIAHAQPDIPSTLNDRAADIWEPLLAIADLAGGDWPALARQAALKLSGSVDDDITLIGYFLADIRTVMLNRKVDRILSRDLITVLNPRHDRPWEDLRRGREINEYWLAAKMRELDIRPKHMRVGDTVARGYLLEDVESAFRRYVPNPPPLNPP